jgi:hypothetical protein
VWADICSDLLLPSRIKQREEKVVPSNDFSVSALCPKLNSVTSMVKQTRCELASAIKTGDIQTAHNMMTYYTAQMFAYATGVRAVCSPLACITMFDADTRAVVISDKDGDDFYNSRLCVLPKIVVSQLEAYKKHVASLKQNTYFTTFNSTSQHLLPSFFYLNKDCTSDEIRPSTSFTLQESFFPLPLNSNRRVIRTYLMEKGVNGEAINAFMGHWGIGQEPWGKFSTCSSMDQIELVSQHIEELLKSLDFRVEKGIVHA